MTDTNARFTRDSNGTWLIAVASPDASNTSLMVDRKGRGPVRMSTGRLIGRHPKWHGYYNYERMSKAPTGGNMGHNDDGTTGNHNGSNGGASEYNPTPSPSPASEPSYQTPGAPSGGGDMSEYVKRPELEEYQSKLEADVVRIDERARTDKAFEKVIEMVEAVERTASEGAPVQVNAAPGRSVTIPGGTAHKALADVVALVSAGIHTYLVGPAGTGKTTLSVQVAEALGAELDICGAMLTKHEAIGYCDANGKYVSTAMRDAFEHGHVINWDEVDASSPAALVAVNAMLANDRYTFPDKTVTRHPNFVVIACGNTYGTGADREYVGRMQLDAATLDRFAFVEVGYDEALERSLGMAHYWAEANAPDGGQADAQAAMDWITEVQNARAEVTERKLRHVVSPRATINGCKLLARGVKLSTIRVQILEKGASDDVQAALKKARV